MHVSVKLDRLEKSEYFNPQEISIGGRRLEKFSSRGDEFVKYFLYNAEKSFLLIYMWLRKGEKEISRGDKKTHRIKYNAVAILVSDTRDTTDEIMQNIIPEKLKLRKNAPDYLQETLESQLDLAFDSFKKDEIRIAASNLETNLHYSGFA